MKTNLTIKNIIAIMFAIATIVFSGYSLYNWDTTFEDFKETTEEQVEIIEENLPLEE